MSSTSRTLVVMRHAKAEQVAATDFERHLTERGVDDARQAGRWLAGADVRPDHALVSAATRTHETWEHVAAGAGWDLRPELDRGLYGADVDSALDLLHAVDDAVSTLVVLGHNPTVAHLAQLLDDGEGDPEVANAMVTGFPTCALAVFGFDGAWADVAPGAARLAAFHVGRA